MKTSNGFFTFIKTIVFLGVIVIAFYSGMYITASGYNENANEVMLTSLSNALKSTVDEPIIMIIPEYSLWEKAKYMVTDAPERNYIRIKTSVATSQLFSDDSELNSSWVKSTLLSGQALAVYAWDGTKNGAVYAWDGTKNGIVSAYEWVTGGSDKDINK